MSLKIGLMGTHGIGKTTLLYSLAGYLKNRGYNVAFVEEMSRKCPFAINEATSFEAQFWIQLSQIREEIEKSKEDIILTDRTVLDNFAYLLRKARVDGGVPEGKLEMMRNIAKFWVKSYDYVFFIQPIEMEDLSDGVRATDEKFRNEIHKLIGDLIEEAGVKVHHVDGSTGERIDRIIEVIELPPKQKTLSSFNGD